MVGADVREQIRLFGTSETPNGTKRRRREVRYSSKGGSQSPPEGRKNYALPEGRNEQSGLDFGGKLVTLVKLLPETSKELLAARDVKTRR